MNYAYEPASFGLDWLMYVIIGPFLHLFAFLICCLGMTACAAIRKEFPKLPGRLYRLGAVLIILIPIAGVFNATWCHLVAGRLYVQEIGPNGGVLDVDSPEDDFTPFIPPSHAWLMGLPGHLVGVTMPQLQLVWLFFAATAWSISFILYRIIKQKVVPFFRLDHPLNPFPVSPKIPLIPS